MVDDRADEVGVLDGGGFTGRDDQHLGLRVTPQFPDDVGARQEGLSDAAIAFDDPIVWAGGEELRDVQLDSRGRRKREDVFPEVGEEDVEVVFEKVGVGAVGRCVQTKGARTPARPDRASVVMRRGLGLVGPEPFEDFLVKVQIGQLGGDILDTFGRGWRRHAVHGEELHRLVD